MGAPTFFLTLEYIAPASAVYTALTPVWSTSSGHRQSSPHQRQSWRHQRPAAVVEYIAPPPKIYASPTPVVEYFAPAEVHRASFSGVFCRSGPGCGVGGVRIICAPRGSCAFCAVLGASTFVLRSFRRDGSSGIRTRVRCPRSLPSSGNKPRSSVRGVGVFFFHETRHTVVVCVSNNFTRFR